MKKALIIINISKDESMKLSKEISAFLSDRNVSTDFYSFDGFCDNTSFEEYDFVVTLGGDGTVLFAARNCVELGIPLFAVNLGEFGFIASVQPSEWKENLSAFLDGKAEITKRRMIRAEVYRDHKLIYSSLGLNDVVISAKRAARTISLDILHDSLPLCKLKSDGVIISTPTGSTAYSAAAGGPILDPELNALVLTPVNSFSLSSRPIVLNPEGVISIILEKSRTKEISITVDGQEPVSLKADDVVQITEIKEKVNLLCSSRKNFYNALRSKLNWTGGPHA